MKVIYLFFHVYICSGWKFDSTNSSSSKVYLLCKDMFFFKNIKIIIFLCKQTRASQRAHDNAIDDDEDDDDFDDADLDVLAGEI